MTAHMVHCNRWLELAGAACWALSFFLVPRSIATKEMTCRSAGQRLPHLFGCVVRRTWLTSRRTASSATPRSRAAAAIGEACHFADAISQSLLKHLLKVEGVQQSDSLADG